MSEKVVMVIPPYISFDGFMSQCEALDYNEKYCLEFAKNNGAKEEDVKRYLAVHNERD